jgi:hypothetical protein
MVIVDMESGERWRMMISTVKNGGRNLGLYRFRYRAESNWKVRKIPQETAIEQGAILAAACDRYRIDINRYPWQGMGMASSVDARRYVGRGPITESFHVYRNRGKPRDDSPLPTIRVPQLGDGGELRFRLLCR